MPIYEYKCENCGLHFERLQKLSDELIKECPECQGPVKKVITGSGLIFKGSGFYLTDYARKKSSAAGDSDTPKKSGDDKVAS